MSHLHALDQAATLQGQLLCDLQTVTARESGAPDARGQLWIDLQGGQAPGVGQTEARGHIVRDAHVDTAPRPSFSVAGGGAMERVDPTEASPRRRQRSSDTADGGANADTAPIPATPRRRRVVSTPIDPDTAAALVLYYADIVGDLEQARLAAASRLRALVAPPPWGKGINAALPEVVVAEAGLAETKALEAAMTARLRQAMAAHPLGPWVAATLGLGEKSMARWLAAVGDLAARESPAQVWAYCGLHVLHPDQGGQHGSDLQFSPAPLCSVNGEGHSCSDVQSSVALTAGLVGDAGDHSSSGANVVGAYPSDVPGIAPRRARGTKANWSTTAKTRLYVVAEACVKVRTSPYRAVYDEAREHYAEAVHAHPCSMCKAAPGEALRDAHRHARAMRAVMKRIALHAWKEARAAAGLPYNKNRKARAA